MSLLTVRDLAVEFPVRSGFLQRRRMLRAVDGVSLTVAPGEALGIVGESGCGKTTLARAILGLVPVSSGSVRLDGEELTALDAGTLRRRRAKMQIVFQDPLAALDPRMTVRELVAEPLRVHRPDLSAAERSARVAAILERVGLASTAMGRYPHQFSGGQCQRIGIARALVLKPDLVICDEPVSALDLSVRAQILGLLAGLQQEMGLSLIFIAHDLGAVRQLCQRVLVMYAGRVVEEASLDRLLSQPAHPYTRGLLACAPELGRPDKPLNPIPGRPPSLNALPEGCHFAPRCPEGRPACSRGEMPFRPFDRGRLVRCIRAEELLQTRRI
jgi:oligopeptide/dipeptide ABC transporter ATP-binding protein